METFLHGFSLADFLFVLVCAFCDGNEMSATVIKHRRRLYALELDTVRAHVQLTQIRGEN